MRVDNEHGHVRTAQHRAADTTEIDLCVGSVRSAREMSTLEGRAHVARDMYFWTAAQTKRVERTAQWPI